MDQEHDDERFIAGCIGDSSSYFDGGCPVRSEEDHLSHTDCPRRQRRQCSARNDWGQDREAYSEFQASRLPRRSSWNHPHSSGSIPVGSGWVHRGVGQVRATSFVEAPRARKQDKGFRLVAQEVRQLAERTAKFTREIADRIDSAQRGRVRAMASLRFTRFKSSSWVEQTDHTPGRRALRPMSP